MNLDQPRREAERTYSGKVFISGVGFLVTAAMWAMLAYFRHRGDNADVLYVDTALSLLHLFVGIAILKRVHISWYVGILLALSGIAFTVFDGYFLPVFCDSVLAILLFFSRADLLDPHGTIEVSGRSRR